MRESLTGKPSKRSHYVGPAPWSLRPARLGWKGFTGIGAGALIAAAYIGTGDISIATTMGAKFGYGLWWTYFVLGLAAFAIVDMSVRYYLRTGKTPMSIFKEVHPALAVYMYLAIIICAIYGSYSQWNACAMVVTGFFKEVPLEVGGGLAALSALLFLLFGVYKSLERVALFGLLILIVAFFAAALRLTPDWSEVAAGLIPRAPKEGGNWQPLFQSNAGSMINAWLILLYPYTMMEKRWRSNELQGQVDLLQRVRWDYGLGIAAAGIVALPLMICAAEIARPFGIVPRSYMDLSVLLSPVAGGHATYLFLGGLFLAAWTSGIGWWVCGAYAICDILREPIKLDSTPMRKLLILFFIPSVALLLLHIDPVYQILIFAAFLTLVFPVVGLALLWRITRPDMGYFAWGRKNVRGWIVILLDIFAIGVSLWVGWGQFREVLGQARALF